jgi:hypothetical protein
MPELNALRNGTAWLRQRFNFRVADARNLPELKKQKSQPASQMLPVVAWILVQTHPAKKALKTGIRTQAIKQQVGF